MVLQTLNINHVLKNLLCWFKVVPRPVEGLFAYRLCTFIVKTLEIRMSQALFDVVSFEWTEVKHLS
jgi:hypothetical protein